MSDSPAHFHYGSRLRQLVHNSIYSMNDIAEKMGYAGRGTLYQLFEKEWIKRDVLLKALDAIGSTEDKFFGLDPSKVEESQQPYPARKKYIEDQITELYQMMDKMDKQIRKLEKSLSHE